MIIALSFSMAIMVTIPAGVIANQQTANNITSGLNGAISQTGQSINQTLSQNDLHVSSGFSGFGFNGGTTTGGAGGRGGFGGFGGGGGGGFFGQAGGGAFGRESTPMNASLYSGLGEVSGVAAVEPTLQVPEGQNHNETFTSGRIQRHIKRFQAITSPAYR